MQLWSETSVFKLPRRSVDGALGLRYTTLGWITPSGNPFAVKFFWGPGKRGHIVPDTLLPMMFLGLCKMGNICCGHFWTKSETFFVSRTQNLCPQQMLRAGKRGNICVGNNVSATMSPRLPGPSVISTVQCTCFIILGTFRRGPRQNNKVNCPTSASSGEREPRSMFNIFTSLLEI